MQALFSLFFSRFFQFLNTGLSENDTSLRRLHRLTVNGWALLAFLLSLVALPLMWLRYEVFLFMILAGVAFFHLVFLFLLFRRNSFHLVGHYHALVAGGTFGLIFFVGAHKGSPELWTYLYFPLAYLLVGRKAGTVYSLVFLAAVYGTCWYFGKYGYFEAFSPLLRQHLLTDACAFLGFNFLYQAIIAKQSHHLELATMVDGLTQMTNKRGILPILEHLQADFNRNAREYVCILADVDHLGGINKKYGKAVGDQVLAVIAAQLKTKIRKLDKIARYGDDEFLIILPDAPLDKGVFVAEKLRLAILQLNDLEQKLPEAVTISLAVGVISETKVNEHLLRDTTGKLATAKETGRNCVQF